MAERTPLLFCASCGTVSSEEGECPQCAKPLKRLGRVGSYITESRKNTQLLINNENIKSTARPITRINSKADHIPFVNTGGVAERYLTMLRTQQSMSNLQHSPPLRPTSVHEHLSSPEQQRYPRQAYRGPSMPMLLSPPDSPPFEALSLHDTSKEHKSDAKNTAKELQKENKTSSSPSQSKKYLTAALVRFSQVFKKNRRIPDEAGYSSAPDLSLLPTGDDAERKFRRRSSIDIGRTQSVSNIPTSPGSDVSSPLLATSTPTSPNSFTDSSDSHSDASSPSSSSSLIFSPNPAQQKSKLSLKMNTDRKGEKGPPPMLSKARSVLNITFKSNSAKPESLTSPPQTMSLPYAYGQRAHPPSPLAQSSPLNPFSYTHNDASQNGTQTPRSHTPPSRPLPTTPARRNTVHNDAPPILSPEFPSSREIPGEWLNFGKSERASATPSPKGEITIILPAKAESYFHAHIPGPPRGLDSDEMREKIAQELITTEYEYVNDLFSLVCAKNEMERFLHKNELSSIFNNIDQIYSVNETIYKNILANCGNPQRHADDDDVSSRNGTNGELPTVDEKVTAIAKTFLELAHSMRIYVKYSLGHQRAYEKLKVLMETEEYVPLMKEVESMPGFKGSEIMGYLIKPVQRICRYPLLLKEIAKSTPAGHHTLPELQEAVECVEETIVEINEAQRAIERELNLMRAQNDLNLMGMDIDVMSPTRMLILDGPMRLVPIMRKARTKGGKTVKRPKQGHYFLFDDFFLFVMVSKKKETPHIFIPTDQTLVTDAGENALEIIHSGHDIWMFVLPSYHDKIYLTQKMNQIIEESLQEAKNRNSFSEKSGKSTLNIATLSRGIKTKRKKGRDISEIF